MRGAFRAMDALIPAEELRELVARLPLRQAERVCA